MRGQGWLLLNYEMGRLVDSLTFRVNCRRLVLTFVAMTVLGKRTATKKDQVLFNQSRESKVK